MLASALVACLRRPLALDQAELVTIYIMLAVACCVPGMGFTQFIIPCLLGSTYYATPENNWDFLYNQYIPSWMIPRGENAARFFFEGLPEGEVIPWDIWVVPLSFWYGFFSSAQLRHDLHHGHSTSPVDGPRKASFTHWSKCPWR